MYTTTPKTEDTLTPISVHGRMYAPKDNAIVIPLADGREAVVKLFTEGLKRKDWLYHIYIDNGRHIVASYEHLVKALHLLIKEEDLV